MVRDLPSISTSNYATATTAFTVGDFVELGNTRADTAWVSPETAARHYKEDGFRRLQQTQRIEKILNEEKTMTRRLVQVFIADSNENVPLEDALLFRGEPKFTDATDQELFFEIDIKNILEKHNEKRVKLVDKKVKERTEHLEPAKIRDLKMVVVEIAKF